MGHEIGQIARLVGIVASFAIPVPALAASFDCAHTTSPDEKLICRDAVLSKLDDQLARFYQTRRAVLSPHGADLLRNSQRGWRRFIGTVCADAVRPNGGRGAKFCLENEYRARLRELAMVGQTLGPFVFNRIDQYETKTTPGALSGPYLGFYVRHVAYPQIDNPRSPQAVAWNRQSVKVISEDGQCGAGGGDYDTVYEIGYANERVISVQWTDWYYCDGDLHGSWRIRTQNTVLQPTIRALSERDVFEPSDGWVGKLQVLFWDALSNRGWKPFEGTKEDVKREIEEDVIQADRWVFTPEGLKVSFDPDTGGCYYVCAPQPVTVPWAELKPLLSHDAVLP